MSTSNIAVSIGVDLAHGHQFYSPNFSCLADYVRLLKYGDSLYRCKELKRAALVSSPTLSRTCSNHTAPALLPCSALPDQLPPAVLTTFLRFRSVMERCQQLQVT